MSDYIDREDLLREIERRGALMVGDKRISVEAMRLFIKNRPAADVVPAVHGRCINCTHSYEDLCGLACSYGPLVDCTVRRDFYCAYWKDKAEKQTEVRP